ncbi:MAG: pyridoxamine 5'-phosphate oxidase family protein [Thermodesulfovibrionales bacterium]|nr:pyridoxamine 5'-phosphate oxidase family protein [Thermodesulfovibrionales bacterium]
MKKMKASEIREFLKTHTWATLCTVSAEGSPYAIEFSYFLLDGYICGLIKSTGTTARNIATNPNVCLKVCRSDDACKQFTAVSLFGKAEFVHDTEAVLKGWDLLERRLKLQPGTYAKFKERFIKKKNKYPMFRMKPEKMTGITTILKED